jgi:Cu(I)/Ag(I) efflux system membrane fusion protein
MTHVFDNLHLRARFHFWSRSGRRALMYSAVLAIAIGIVYVTTRGKGAPATKTAARDRAAPSATSGGRPIALTPAEAQRIGVTYAVAAIGPMRKTVRTVGQVTLDETRVRTIALKIDGWIERLLANATGQPVSAGQPLLIIYSPMLVSAQEEMLLATRLRREVGAASDEARASADDLLASARRRLAYWDIPDDEIEAIERTGRVRKTLTLRSPVGGYVLEKNVLSGQKIMAGDPLFKVADLRTVWVEGEVFEQDLAAVHIGQIVDAAFDALPGENRSGQISYIYPTLNPETRTVRVRVILSNSDMRLKPGMYATIRIATVERASVLTVPRSAVLSTGERSIVFVREASGQLVPREVALGASSDDRVEILRGLVAGETVVASATFLVDAESNLGEALGGMGNMPGMELTTPPKPLPTQPRGKE